MMIFGELDHRLSVVNRWSVLTTIRKQSVAEHSYNVAVISIRIAENWLGLTQPDILLAISKRALFHDWWESITGDFPTYMKRFVDEAGAVMEFEANGAAEGVDLDAGHGELARVIVKSADYIDAMIFLRMEISLGNKTVLHHLRAMEKRFKIFLSENPINNVKVDSFFAMYQTEIVDRMFNSDGQFISELHGFPK